MRPLAERAYFRVCSGLGWLLRSTKYSQARIVRNGGTHEVQKSRLFYAPLLVSIGEPLVTILGTGVRVLHQRDWQEQEQRIYRTLRRASIRVHRRGTLVLPRLAGETLARLLEDPAIDAQVRNGAIERAVVALRGFHQLGLTHGDAMAENVLVDLDAGVAHWFDFETAHDPGRPAVWRRADDLRALLTSCLVRTVPGTRAATLRLILNAYEDEEVVRVLAARFTSTWRRSLPFHLAQAPLSFESSVEIARLLRERITSATP
jgi:hypothetical protein